MAPMKHSAGISREVGESRRIAAIPNPEEQPFITVEQTAELLGMGRNVAYRAVAEGQIPSIRVGKLIRVPTAAIRRLAGLDD